jgi:hypothetical protein
MWMYFKVKIKTKELNETTLGISLEYKHVTDP